MLKALLKKQFSEMFAFCFQNRKTGRRNKAGRVILLLGVLALCYFSLAMAFVWMSDMFADELVGNGQDWLYMSLAGLAALCMGTVGSVFATYSMIYKAKDNDLLLSMPVPPGTILLSRMAGVYCTGLLFVSLSWLPAIIVYAVRTVPPAVLVAAEILMTFLIAAAVMAIGCLLGWLVALAVSRIRHKHAATLVLTVLGIGLYYLFCFRMEALMEEVLRNIAAFRQIISSRLYPIYQLGVGAAGSAGSYLIFAGIALGLALLSYMILAKTFTRLVTTNRGEKKRASHGMKTRESGVPAALLRKEFKRWYGSTAYMLNTGIGLLIMVAAAVLLFIKNRNVRLALNTVRIAAPWLTELLPPFAALSVCLLTFMNMITAPSVSLEGKYLWVLRSAPVDSRDILNAKQRLHILLNLLPTALMSAAMIAALRPGPLTAVLCALTPFAAVCLTSAAGLALNLKMPNLTWTNETVPVKSGAPVAITMFGGWVLTALLGYLCYLTRNAMTAEWQLAAILAILTAGALLLNRWIRIRGTRIFDGL